MAPPATTVLAAAPELNDDVFIWDLRGLAWSSVVWVGLLAVLVDSARRMRPLGLLQRVRRLEPAMRDACVLFLVLAAAALFFTWRSMLRMVAEDMSQTGTSNFFVWMAMKKSHRSSSLFFEAYTSVVNSPAKMWLSAQVMLSVVSLVPLLAWEGQRARLGDLWRFLWIAFAVAVSVALPAFVVAWLLGNHASGSQRRLVPTSGGNSRLALLALCFSTAVGVGLMMLYPVLRDIQFTLAVIVSHAVMFAPLLGPFLAAPPVAQRMRAYFVAAALCLACHAFNTARLWLHWPMPGHSILDVVIAKGFPSDNHAQCSISFDLVFIALTCSCLFLADPLRAFSYHTGRRRLALVALTPVLSPATTLPLYLAFAERARLIEEAEDATKKD